MLYHVWIILCSQYSDSDGKVTKILKNSWTKHLSVTYNDKYNYGNYYQKIIIFHDDTSTIKHHKTYDKFKSSLEHGLGGTFLGPYHWSSILFRDSWGR